jgi:ABC-type branched-subunit amino acid transport system substrate-binding protein
VDNAGSVEGGATSVRSLLAEKPFAMVIIRTSSFSGAVQVLSQQDQKTPTFALASGAAVKTANLPNVFGMYTDYNVEAQFGVKNLISNLGHKRIGLLFDPTLDPAAPDTLPDYASSLGGEIVKQVSVTSDATNFVPMVQQMKDADVDAVFLDTTLPTTAGFLKSAAQSGLTVDMGTFSGNLDPSLFSVAGDAAEGLYINSLYPPLDSGDPEIDKFKAATDKYAPDAFTGQGENGWAAAVVFNTAVERATSGGADLTTSDFEEQLYKMNGETVGFAQIAYAKGDQAAIGGIDSLSVYRVQGGKFVKG